MYNLADVEVLDGEIDNTLVYFTMSIPGISQRRLCMDIRTINEIIADLYIIGAGNLPFPTYGFKDYYFFTIPGVYQYAKFMLKENYANLQIFNLDKQENIGFIVDRPEMANFSEYLANFFIVELFGSTGSKL